MSKQPVPTYEYLLEKPNLVDWLYNLSQSPKLNVEIKKAALALSQDINGNTLSNTPAYETLYKEYQFKIIQTYIGDGSTLGYVLYKYIPVSNLLTYVGNIKDSS